MKCQLRIDPTGHLEQLGHMRIDERCQFAFKAERPSESENEQQGQLGV